MQPMQFGLRQYRGYAIFEPSEYMQVKYFPGIDRISPLECDWNHKLGIGIRKLHTGGHDADDASRYAINAKGLPVRIRILAESLLPVSVAQHDNQVLSGLFLVSGEEPPHKRMNSQRVKGVGHDRGP